MELPREIHCPWCGETFTTFVDISLGMQNYTEDCQVCCRPIDLAIELGEDGEVAITAQRE